MSKRSTKGTPSGIILPRGGQAGGTGIPIRAQDRKDLGSDERNPSDDLKSTENDPRAGEVKVGEYDNGELVAKDCPGCGEREAGPYCVEVEPAVTWPMPGSALGPQGPVGIRAPFRVPVWLCKQCFEQLYGFACKMVNRMVTNSRPEKSVTEKS